jgi:DNA polymerase-1
MPLIPVLTNYGSSGINIDTNALHEYSKILNNKLIETEKNIYQHAGITFNIASQNNLGTFYLAPKP